MPIFNNILAGSSGQGDTGYDIDQSLRFNNPDTPYLSFTPSSTATSTKICTISCWVKRGQVDQERRIFAAAQAGSTPRTDFTFNGSGYLTLGLNPTGGAWYQANTSMLFRDPSAWYHIVWALDTSQATASNRSALYVNGEQVTDFSSNTLNDSTAVPQDSTILMGQSGMLQVVGAYANILGQSAYDGYMAEFHFIDGQKLTPASFGETNSATNQWVPIEVTGMTYGTNGFYQKYSATELANSFTDSVLETTWTAPAGVTSVDYLVVGGGGGGGSAISASGTGYEAGGGGGAGGLQTGTLSVTPGTTYSITIGGGGTAGSAGSGGDGTNSTFATITANGGGGGGQAGTTGRAGGSGGGAGSAGGSGGSATQGNAGGSAAAWGGGGGGGHSASGTAGDTGTNSYGGPGGNGTASSLSGSSVTYAGGGGGGSTSGSNNASGGSGGGGAGGSYGNNDTVAGTANTGGGGGGAGGDGPRDGAAGGSGIVVLYDGTTRTSFTTVSPTQHTITANGDVANSRAQAKIGDSSIKFDGTADYLSVADSADWALGSNFTVETWVRFASTSSDLTLLNHWKGNGVAAAWTLQLDGGNTVKFFYSTDGTNSAANSSWSWTPSLNTWYHVAVVRDGSDLELYIDGTQTGSTYDISSSTIANIAWPLEIGYYSNIGGYGVNGYMDEIRISNSTRYTGTFTPSTTAFTADANTLLLIHSDFDGGLGADSSGNKNDFSATNLVATDQVLDSPTNNFATLNPLAVSKYAITSMGEGNLYYAGGSSYTSSIGSIAPTSGKWYTEVYVNANNGTNGNNSWLGVTRTDYPGQAWWDTPFNRTGSVGLQGNGQAYKDGSTTSSDSSGDFDSGDIVGILMNLDDGEIKFKVNNSDFSYTTSITVDGVWTPCVQSYSTGNNVTFNFGQDSSFAGNKTAQGNGGVGEDFYYAPPTGYKALNTDNLDSPAIALPGDHFETALYTGNGSTQTISSLNFQPDLVWTKPRSIASSHGLTDSVRGAGRSMKSNDASAEVPTGTPGATDDMYAFTSNGFSVGTDNYLNINQNTVTYASWNWKAGGTASSNSDGSITSSVSANPTAGFSIVSYTGTGANATIGHGLSQAPEIVIVKSRDSAEAWNVYAEPVSADPATDYLILNSTAAVGDDDRLWNDTAPTSSVIHLGFYDGTNKSADGLIAYCFHSVEGYSKVGSYTGNSSADGTFVYTGFKPAYVLMKASSGSGHWNISDSVRDPDNPVMDYIYANNTDVNTPYANWDFLSNGFKLRINDSYWNGSGVTYIYLAIAESPFKTSNAR